MLDPESFLALAREQEVIAGLDTWVVSEACRQMAAWSASGVVRLRVSVNVATRSLAVEGFAASIENAVRTWGTDPAMIELEVSGGEVESSREAGAAAPLEAPVCAVRASSVASAAAEV